MTAALPVVFLHAFPLSARMWQAEVAALERDRPALAPNFPGFGGRRVAEPDLGGFAEAVLGDLDAAGIQRAVFVGLSMGGYVAFRLFERAPSRFAGLVLADTRAGADCPEAKARRTEQAARVRREGVGWLADSLLPLLVGETTRRERPEVVASIRALIADCDPEGVARALLAMRDRPDSTALLGRVRVPALVLVGSEDTLTPPEEARELAGALGSARLEVIPAAGHLSNLENPEAFDAALIRFLAGLSGSGGP